MPTPTLITYRDAIEHLVTYEDALSEEAQQVRARSAIQEAYREVGMETTWRYFQQHHRISTSDQYTTGTVTYDSDTKVVTGSSTSFPTWARYGSIIFSGDSVIYRVATRNSATSLTLETNFAPTADKSSGTYTLYRSIYPLPGDFYRLEEVFDEATWKTTYLEPSDWLELHRHIPRGGRPWYWTLMGDADMFGSMAICFYGRCDTGQSMDFIYSRMPRRLKYDGYAYYSSQGNATLTAAAQGDTVATVDNVSLETDVVNAVLRTAMTGATKPPGGMSAMERYAEQKVISVRDSASQVTVSSAFEFGYASTHFTISDPVDLPAYLLDPFFRGCEYYMALLQQKKDRREAYDAYQMAIRRARGKDIQVPPAESALATSRWRHPSWQFLTGTITQY